MNPANLEPKYDAIIIGAGAAGLSAALGFIENSEGLANKPKLLVISKLQALRSHTGSAEGGIAASLSNEEPDNWKWHYYDTVRGGAWLVDQDAAKLLTQNASETVIKLEHSGVAFSRKQDGHISQRNFGGHSSNYGEKPIKRAAYAADRIGHQILTSLWQQCIRKSITIAEEWYVSDLALDIEHKCVEGIVAINTHSGTVQAIQANSVILCTGGAGRLFHTTTNSWDLTADGMSLALRSGLQLEDIEFIQFHPTGLGHTGILLSEAARGEGGVLRNAKGQAFMEEYSPEYKDLAPRDVVTRAVINEINEGRGVKDPTSSNEQADCVWLDLTGINPKTVSEKLPQVEETIRLYSGLDPNSEMIPVKPTAHYMMGGIPTTTDGQVYHWNKGERNVVEGLYAAGECACTGLHGANRLGGNSLLDACFFGYRSGKHAVLNLATLSDRTISNSASNLAEMTQKRSDYIQQLLNNAVGTQNNSSNEKELSKDNAYFLINALGKLMEDTVTQSYNESNLQAALVELTNTIIPAAKALPLHDSSATFNQELTALMEAQNLTLVAQAVLRSSLARKESRGAFQRSDFPKTDNDNFLQHSIIDSGGQMGWQPVHIVDFEPSI